MSPYRPITSYAPRGYASPVHVAPSGFELADLIRLIDARRKLILKVMLATILCALVAALLLPTTFSSSSQVMLDPRKNNVTELTAVLSQLPADPASVQNQLQILQSRDLAGTVADQLNLDRDPEFNPTLAGPGVGQLLGEMVALLNPKNWFSDDAAPSAAIIHERVVDALQKHVTVTAEGLSTTITIAATSREAAKAALIANTFANDYVKLQVSQKLTASTTTTDWLNKRLSDLSQQLQAQEAAVQRYKAQHNLNDSAPGNSLVDQQMAAINAQIVQARSELAEKQAIQDRISQLVASGNPADIGQIVASPLIVQLRSQQASLITQEADLASKYGPLHPKMQAVEQQKRDVDANIAQEVGRLAASAANDVVVSRAHLGSLQGSLGGTEGLSHVQNMARVQLQALESNAASTRIQYEAFVQRLRGSQNMDDVVAPESRIISQAPVPSRPAGPKRLLIVGASIPLGLLLGLIAALLVEKIGPLMPVRVNGVRTASIVPAPVMAPVIKRPMPARAKAAPRPQPVAVWSGPPILAEINDPAQLRAADFVLDYPDSKYSHIMAALVRQLESRDGEGALIAVTSAEKGESRSAIAVSIARAAARMGKKAIVVDCAPGHLASRAMRARVRNGLYEVLTGAVPLNKALAKDSRGEVYLLGTAKPAPNNLTMYTSEPMARLVDVLRAGADMVVMDCGAAVASADAATLARLADATVLVSRKGALNSPLVANAARVLESARAAPVGIVVTK